MAPKYTATSEMEALAQKDLVDVVAIVVNEATQFAKFLIETDAPTEARKRYAPVVGAVAALGAKVLDEPDFIRKERDRSGLSHHE